MKRTVLALLLSIGVSTSATASPIRIGAHWGAHIPNQKLGPRDCLAENIEDPALHPAGFRYLIDNTIPSILTAFAFGADTVTINPRATKDANVVLYHDGSLDCRTDGVGKISDHTLQELQRFNAAWNFSPDEGATYPWREPSVVKAGYTWIPSVDEVFSLTPTKGYWIVLRPTDPDELRVIISRLNKYPEIVANSMFYFSPVETWIAPILETELPAATIPRIRIQAMTSCLKTYQEERRVTSTCSDLDLFVSFDYIKSLGDDVLDFGKQLKNLAKPSTLNIGSPSGDFIDDEKSTRYLLKYKEVIDGVATDRIDIIGKLFKHISY